jgi:hypothetical protein
MNKISWVEGVRDEEELLKNQEEGNIVCTIRRRKAGLIGHILHRTCF